MLKSYICFDIETTGLSPVENEVLEIGALKVREGKVTRRFIEFIRPAASIPEAVTRLTGITDAMVSDARDARSVIPDFIDFCEDDVLIGHNVIFDYSFIKSWASANGLAFEKEGIDTLKIARKVLPDLESRSLESLCAHYQIENPSAHRAYHDALATAKLYQTLAHYFESGSPSVFQPSPLQYRPKKVLPATAKQIALLRRLTAGSHAGIDWDPDTLTRNEASRLIDRLLHS